jgi:hypothetical protein
MKLSFKLILILWSVGCSTSGFAQETVQNNLPEVSRMRSVGRAFAFPTLKNTMWFTSTAFSVDFDCSPRSAQAGGMCRVRIHNMVSDAEESALRELAMPPQKIIALRDIDSPLVFGIQDQFRSLPHAFAPGNFLYLNTLALGKNISYSSAYARVSGAEADSLNSLFNGEGLGTFQTDFQIQGELTQDYVALDNTEALKAFLLSLNSEPLSLFDLKQKLKTILSASPMTLNNWTKEEATTAIYREVIQNDLSPLDGKYTANVSALNRIPVRWEVIDETSKPKLLQCRSSIELRRGAVAKTVCSGGSNEQR